MTYSNIITRATSLLDILRDRAKYQPDKQAYIFLQNGETESGSLSYGELDRQARAIAAHLQSWQGERALLLYPSGLEFITAFFGCLYAGVVAVPVYPPRRNQKLSRLLSIVNDAQAKLALTTISILADIDRRWEQEADLLADLKWVATDPIEANRGEFVPQSVTRSSLAFLQYTSGSTGTPKGVMVTHGNIIHNQQLIQQAFGHSEHTMVVGWLPLFHDMGLIGNVLQPIYLGITCILMPPVAFLMKPIRWLQVISKYRATTSGGPNFAYDLCVKKVQPEQLAKLDLSSWDLAFNGAEPVRAQTLEQFGKKFAQCGFNYSAFYPCYGMAETTLFATGGDKNHLPVIQGVKAGELEQNSVVESEVSSAENLVFVGCGRPYMDTTVIIVNPESLTRCKKGQVGEIWVTGGSIASGYWNRPQVTQEKFQAYLKDTGEGPFLCTGDLGFLSDGELFVTGRLKDLIIIRGQNHYPQDIELTVENSHPSLRNYSSAVFSVEMEGEERLVVACEVERTYLRNLNPEEVVKGLRKAVSEEHDLQLYAVVLLKTGSIPKTSSGKIQRHACRTGFLNGSLDVLGEWTLNLQEMDLPPLQTALEMQLEQGENEVTHFMQRLEVTPVKERRELLVTHVREQIARVLGLKVPEQIELRQSLFDLGIDSLMAVELRTRLQKSLGQTFPSTLLFDYPTLEVLVTYLIDCSIVKMRESNSLTSVEPRNISEKALGISPVTNTEPDEERVVNNEVGSQAQELEVLNHDKLILSSHQELDTLTSTKSKVSTDASSPKIPSHPLLPTQLLFWHIPSNDYNLSWRLLLKRKILIDVLLDSCINILHRYDVLTTAINTTYPVTQGQWDLSSFQIPVTQHSQLSEDSQLSTQFLHFKQRTFDRQRGPLIRFEIHRTALQETELWIAIDHIATDGYSLLILLRDLDLMLTGQPLPQAKSYYGYDRPAWDTPTQDIEFWQKYLESPPLIKVRNQQYDGRRIPISQLIPREMVANLQQQYPTAKEFEAAIISAAARAVASVTSSSSLSISILRHGRTSETANIFGPFLENQILILRKVPAELNLLLEEVRQEIEVISPHRHTPNIVKYWIVQQKAIGTANQWIVSAIATLLGLGRRNQCLSDILREASAEFAAGLVLRKLVSKIQSRETYLTVNILPSFVQPDAHSFQNFQVLPVREEVALEIGLTCYFLRDSQGQPEIRVGGGGLNVQALQAIGSQIVSTLMDLLGQCYKTI